MLCHDARISFPKDASWQLLYGFLLFSATRHRFKLKFVRRDRFLNSRTSSSGLYTGLPFHIVNRSQTI